MAGYEALRQGPCLSLVSEQTLCLSVMCSRPLRIGGGPAEALSRSALALAPPIPRPSRASPAASSSLPWNRSIFLGWESWGQGQTPEVYSGTLVSSPPNWAYLS